MEDEDTQCFSRGCFGQGSLTWGHKRTSSCGLRKRTSLCQSGQGRTGELNEQIRGPGFELCSMAEKERYRLPASGLKS